MGDVNVKINGNAMVVNATNSYGDLAKKYAVGEDIILVKIGNRIRELSKQVREGDDISFVSTATSEGRKTYRRSLIFLMQKGLQTILPNVNVQVEHSLGDGYFCSLSNGQKLSLDQIEALKAEMKKLVDEDIPIDKYSVKTSAAAKMFGEADMADKERLLKYRMSSNTNIYDLEGCKDYFYGPMAPSTGILKYFDIVDFENGFMLLFPNSKSPREIKPFNPAIKLFNVQQSSSNWAKSIGVKTVGQLNEAISSGKTQDLILAQEALMEEKIGALAQEIVSRGNIKFVMIAGPSSSGKTTFSHRLSAQLRARGVVPHPVPLDDYYKDRELMPIGEDGKYDFEALECLNVDQFNEDMNRLLKGERVLLPTFNFISGKSEYKDHYMQLGDNDILVIEGIHGLNEKMSEHIARENKFKIYISALTQLSIDEHNPLATTDGRLIRRIVRDARTRGTSAGQTIAMWDSVRRGEEKNIFPFQEEADAMFNSALVYEMAALKLYAQPLLFGITPEEEEYSEARRLLKLLDYFLAIPPDAICNNSIVREFIGGSILKV